VYEVENLTLAIFGFLLNETIAEGLGRQGIIKTLQKIGEELANGTFPITKSLTQANV
jgi:hypothetical protein